MLSFIVDTIFSTVVYIYMLFFREVKVTQYYWRFIYTTCYNWVSIDEDKIPFTNFGYDNKVKSEKTGEEHSTQDINALVAGHQTRLHNLIPADYQKQWSCVNLYAAVLSQVELLGQTLDKKHLLEVGCGRGGGCMVAHGIAKPGRYLGVDLSGAGIRRCRRHMERIGGELTEGANVDFRQGNSMELDIIVKEASFDVVYNVESSHCYSDLEGFFNQVYRALKDDGLFLWCDLQPKSYVPGIKYLMRKSGLEILRCYDISPEVKSALDTGDALKPLDELYAKHAHEKPWLVRVIAMTSWNLLGRFAVKSVKSGSLKYSMCCCRKTTKSEKEALMAVAPKMLEEEKRVADKRK